MQRLSVYETADRLGIGVTTLYRWWNKGIIPPPIKIGGRTFWKLETLEAWEAADFPRVDQNEKVEA